MPEKKIYIYHATSTSLKKKKNGRKKEKGSATFKIVNQSKVIFHPTAVLSSFNLRSKRLSSRIPYNRQLKRSAREGAERCLEMREIFPTRETRKLCVAEEERTEKKKKQRERKKLLIISR